VSTWHLSRHYLPCLPSASAFVQTQQAAAARTELLRRCFGTECAAFEQESRACVTCGRDAAGTLKNAFLQNMLPDCARVDGLTHTKRIDELRRKVRQEIRHDEKWGQAKTASWSPFWVVCCA
jgi:hypothetical protein